MKKKVSSGKPKELILKTPSVGLSTEPKVIIKEVIKEVIITKEVEKPQLEGFALYKALKDKGFPQGGAQGQWMEDPNGIENVYIPHANEVQTYFIGDPEKMDAMRDAIIRAYIELC